MEILKPKNIPEVKTKQNKTQWMGSTDRLEVTEGKKKPVNLEDRIIGITQSNQQRENR